MKLAFAASPSPIAHESLLEMEKRYQAVPLEEADCLVALGGDGLVLKTFYSVMDSGTPVFAMRRTSSVGFLCNDFQVENLRDRIEKAQRVVLHPLKVDCVTTEGQKASALALNEIAVLRDSPQSAKLRISVDDVERIARYNGDGLLVATPAGSTAYNHSAGGPIMPLDSNTLVMTAICGYRPRRWSCAVLPQSAVTNIQVLESGKRPVRIEAGQETTHNIAEAQIRLDTSKSFTLLFDPGEHLSERIIREQFMT